MRAALLLVVLALVLPVRAEAPLPPDFASVSLEAEPLQRDPLPGVSTNDAYLFRATYVSLGGPAVGRVGLYYEPGSALRADWPWELLYTFPRTVDHEHVTLGAGEVITREWVWEGSPVDAGWDLMVGPTRFCAWTYADWDVHEENSDTCVVVSTFEPTVGP